MLSILSHCDCYCGYIATGIDLSLCCCCHGLHPTPCCRLNLPALGVCRRLGLTRAVPFALYPALCPVPYTLTCAVPCALCLDPRCALCHTLTALCHFANTLTCAVPCALQPASGCQGHSSRSASWCLSGACRHASSPQGIGYRKCPQRNAVWCVLSDCE